jgi:hypothetical protein
LSASLEEWILIFGDNEFRGNALKQLPVRPFFNWI